MKLFLDANLLIDYYARRERWYPLFVKLLAMRVFGDAELWVSAKSFTDVFYVCKSQVPSADLQRAFANSKEFLSVCSLTEEDIFEAASRSWPDFEDCLVSLCAEKVKADYLVTRDTKGFIQSKTPVIHPDDLLLHLEEQGITYDMIDFSGVST